MSLCEIKVSIPVDRVDAVDDLLLEREDGRWSVMHDVLIPSATIVGLLPLLTATGAGAEVMTRMAAPMVGGMLTAFILTMLVLPAVFLVVKRVERF